MLLILQILLNTPTKPSSIHCALNKIYCSHFKLHSESYYKLLVSSWHNSLHFNQKHDFPANYLIRHFHYKDIFLIKIKLIFKRQNSATSKDVHKNRIQAKKVISSRSIVSFEQKLRLITIQTINMYYHWSQNASRYINSSTVNENQSHGIIS